MRIFLCLILIVLQQLAIAQGPYAGPLGSSTSIAVHKDSSIINGWAINCSIVRGWQQLNNTSLGRATVGDSSLAIGKAMSNGVVSLGDGGMATLQFAAALFDGPGYDFVVYENSFSDDFLELAFVEVSSDGQNFIRFPSQSLTDTTTQVGGFGLLDTRNIHNLAGKYPLGYGTPFDLSDLIGTAGLNLNNITHIRIIDVVGTINPALASRDDNGRKINDPFPTPFPSSGFDLDAVGAIHINAVGIEENTLLPDLSIFPNPAKDVLNIHGIEANQSYRLEIRELNGRLIREALYQNSTIDVSGLKEGHYILILQNEDNVSVKKFFKL